MVLEKTPESPLDCKEIQPVHPKGDQSWVFIGSTDAEAETPILWWSELLFPSPGDFPNAGIEPVSLTSPALEGRFLTTAPPEKPFQSVLNFKKDDCQKLPQADTFF